MGIEVFKKHIREKRAIKISCGISNTDLENVAKICRASQKGRASAVDIPVSKDAFQIAKKNTKLPIFASSIYPIEIIKATKLGVDGVQLGDYATLYQHKKTLSYDEIRDNVLEIMSAISDKDIYTCITIPSTLTLDEQVELVKEFEILGVDLIQTEGYEEIERNQKKYLVSNPIKSIRMATDLSKETILPIMSSSCTTNESISLAFNQGACAVNIDNIPELNSEAVMTTKILQTVGLISYRNSINKEIPRNYSQLVDI